VTDAEPAVSVRHGCTVLVLPADGPIIASGQDVLDLLGDAYGHQADLLAVPVARLDPGFFRLSTGIAGEVVQKFVNYQLRLAVVGDLSQELADSSALRAFVHESNNGPHVWFVEDLDGLDAKLARLAELRPSPPPG
jgi:hypothetical protein